MAEIIALINKLVGLPTAVMLATITGVAGWMNYKEIWVWGRQLREQKAETQFWKTVAFKSLGVSEVAVNIAKSNQEP